MNTDQRMIGVFMAFAVIFALVGKATRGTGSQVAGDAKVILGGTIGAVLLSLLAEAGEGAAGFAKGLAGITLLSSVFINGQPVFSEVSRLSKSTGTLRTTTTATPVAAKG